MESRLPRGCHPRKHVMCSSGLQAQLLKAQLGPRPQCQRCAQRCTLEEGIQVTAAEGPVAQGHFVAFVAAEGPLDSSSGTSSESDWGTSQFLFQVWMMQ